MFVAITRAKEELQISRASQRDFRGQRKTTIPSQFLMELPRAEMEVRQFDVESESWAEGAASGPPGPRIQPVPAGKAAGSPLVTAAALARGGVLPAASPEEFRQGMLVIHPTHGVGKVAALSGSGASRQATVDFAGSPARRLVFVLSKSALCPLKGTGPG